MGLFGEERDERKERSVGMKREWEVWMFKCSCWFKHEVGRKPIKKQNPLRMRYLCSFFEKVKEGFIWAF